MRLALTFMEKHLDQPIQLTDIAEAAKMSTSALETNFRLAYGQPPVVFLLQRRLATAQVFLAQGLKPKEVCVRTGFQSLQYFSRFFRSRVGVSPRAFAAAHRRQLDKIN